MDDQAAAGFAMYAHTADKARWGEVYGIMSMEQGDKLHHLLGDD